MSTIGNLLWLLLGGFCMALGWYLYGILAFLSIVGIPWGRACFVMGNFSLLPFGRVAIARDQLRQRADIGTSALGTLGNILWFIFAGLWLAIGHVVCAIACFCTIIGIPFGLQHLKLAGLAVAPIGKTIVSKEVAAAARQYDAQQQAAAMRR